MLTPQESNLHGVNQLGPSALGMPLDAWAASEWDLVSALRAAVPGQILAELARSLDGCNDPLLIGTINAALLTVDVESDDPQALDACEKVVRYVRRVQNLDGIEPDQRRDFLEQSMHLRTVVRSIALRKANKIRCNGDPAGASEVVLRLLAWCESLEHQLLLEKAAELPGSACAVNVTLPDNFQPGNWPFHPDHYPDPDKRQGGLVAASLASLSSCLGVSEPDGATTEAPPSLSSLPSKVLRDWIAAEHTLEDLLPDRTVWLRALFTADGSLHWWAVHRTGGKLEILAEDARPDGAREELRQANQDFDLVVNDVWSAYQYAQLSIDLETRNDLDQFEKWAEEIPGNRNRSALDLLAPQIQTFLKRMRACASLLPSGGELTDQGKRLLQSAREGGGIGRLQVRKWRAKVNSLAASDEKTQRIQSDSVREQARRNALDQASKHHLEALQKMIDLSRLWENGEKAGLPWKETDILFTVQGPLWRFPLPWLALGEKPLFQRVASTSRVVSLTLRDWASDAAAPSKNLLSAHSLPEEDRPHLLGLPHLHAELRRLGNEYDWKVWGLGDDPAACISFLQAALAQNEPRFGVAVVGGHGDDVRQGVRLAGESLFSGREGQLNLSGLDLLILVVCSAGRLHQTGDRDVEGLYAHLAAKGGRSVIAANWKIADSEAAILVAAIVQQYFDSPSEPFRRARALNRALRIVLDPVGEFRVSWHLAAAFEIHGRG